MIRYFFFVCFTALLFCQCVKEETFELPPHLYDDPSFDIFEIDSVYSKTITLQNVEAIGVDLHSNFDKLTEGQVATLYKIAVLIDGVEVIEINLDKTYFQYIGFQHGQKIIVQLAGKTTNHQLTRPSAPVEFVIP